VQAGSGGRVDSQAPLIYAGALRSSESRIPPCRPPRGARRVRPGDELHIESEVIRGATVEVTYKPSTDQGRTTTLNQNDEAVQVQIANLIVPEDSLPSPGDTVDCDAADRIIGRLPLRSNGCLKSSHRAPLRGGHQSCPSPALCRRCPGPSPCRSVCRSHQSERPHLGLGQLCRAYRFPCMTRIRKSSLDVHQSNGDGLSRTAGCRSARATRTAQRARRIRLPS
jgi:hypothetical protein